MIESLCYRYTPHSTYDGTPVYRTRDEEGEWRERDPLLRTRQFLLSRELIDEDFDDEVGNHFVFVIHLDDDSDRDTYVSGSLGVRGGF